MNIHNKDICISVIVPTRNRSSLLAQTLESIYVQTLPHDRYEVIVVDNASTDNTREVVDHFVEYPDYNINYVLEKRIGLMYGRHTGARAASSDILLYTDDDVCAHSRWVEEILTCFQDEDVVAAGGRILGRFETKIPTWYYQFGTQKNCGVLSLLDFGEGSFRLEPGRHLYGCNFAVRKKALLQVGGFNPDGFPRSLLKFRGNGECGLIDKLYSQHSKVIYCSSAVVEHIIDKNRMSKDYFLNRAHSEGFSKAYTVLRNANPDSRKFVLIKDLIRSGIGILFLAFKISLCANEDRKFKYRFQVVYLLSRGRHALRLCFNHKLSQFVTRSNYFIEHRSIHE